MKFSLISDMHVDFPQNKTPYDKLEKNVIVAGDTSNGLLGLKFLNKLRNKGFNVFAVDGNHEHYSNVSQNRDVYETIDKFREIFPNETNMDGVRVAGCNGWYTVTGAMSWVSYQNDHANIFGKEPVSDAERVNYLAFQDYMHLKDLLDNSPDPLLIVTHTAPCEETLDPRFAGSFSNEWYFNPFMYRLLEKYSHKILAWCHGHTHARSQAIVHGVPVYCNPRGYPNENPEWEPLTIEIEIKEA